MGTTSRDANGTRRRERKVTAPGPSFRLSDTTRHFYDAANELKPKHKGEVHSEVKSL